MSAPADYKPFVQNAAQALGLPLDPAWTDAVCTNVAVILQFAKTVEEFPLPDHAEPAPVFRA